MGGSTPEMEFDPGHRSSVTCVFLKENYSGGNGEYPACRKNGGGA